MKNAPNKQYNIASSNSLPVRIATKQRRRIFDDFLNVCSVSSSLSDFLSARW